MSREWFESRSLLEMKMILDKVDGIEVTGEHSDALCELLKRTRETEKNKSLCIDCLIRLDELSSESSWFRNVFEESGKSDFVWKDLESFTEVCQSIPSKKAPYLFDITLSVKDADWLTDLAVMLPLRFMASAEKAMKAREIDEKLLIEKVEKLFEKQDVYCDHILWLWKSNSQNKKKFITSSIIFKTLSREISGEYTKARAKLATTIEKKEKFLKELLEGDSAKIKVFLKLLKLYRRTSKLNEMKVKTALIKLFPEYSNETTKKITKTIKAYPRLTSIASYEQRRKEWRDINEKEIPQNSKDIGVARERGDLRENAEYKAAKERQSLLAERSAILGEELSKISTTAFADIKVAKKVVLGSSVTFEVDGEEKTHHIMGVWDSNPHKNILSCDTPLAKVLNGLTKGVKFTHPNGKKGKILKITKLPKKIAKEADTSNE
ncbi:MAG: GreA/GreB family elongation factor [Verrucomicrobiota bacterium]|nr:GreA/GreB family elongation factor [Verrucomicrobiota bacterium]